MAIGSFLESYDLLGKTIIPFCTSQDNDISVSMDYIKAVASGANVLDGYRIHAADVDDVKEWLQRIGVLNENNTKDLNAEGNSKMETENSDKRYGSGIVPDELEYIPDGYEAPADQQGYGSDDFFIFAASGTSDFAYHAFKAQIMAMAQDSDGMFKFANNETDGNLSFWREKAMNMIRRRVMSTRIMDYDFSGMHSKKKYKKRKVMTYAEKTIFNYASSCGDKRYVYRMWLIFRKK